MSARAYRSSVTTRALRGAGVVLLVLLTMGIGPCGRMPGGMILGATEQQPVEDWSFTRDYPTCAVEVRHRDPYSVTAACFADAGGALYVGCMSCPGKGWSSYAMADPIARVQFGSAVYPVTIRRLTGAAERQAAWQARHDKFGRGDPDAVPDQWWLFSLSWRDPEAG